MSIQQTNKKQQEKVPRINTYQEIDDKKAASKKKKEKERGIEEIGEREGREKGNEKNESRKST